MHRFSPKFALRPAAVIACAAAIVSLSGCAGISGSAVSSSLATSIPKGSVHGGQQPIVGSHVYVYAANLTGGYGSASTSLIASGPTTSVDSNGNYYVTTDASGGFNYGGTVTCNSNTDQIYLLAVGGNPTGVGGNSTSNSAITLAAALGTCGSILPTTFTSMNEVTTAAFGYALNAFAVDGAHVGTTSTNVTGLTRAFTTAASLVDVTTGTALATTTNGGVVPQKKINSIANALAPCANSSSPSSTACTNLITYTNSTSINTLSAVLALGAQPAFNAAGVYLQAQATAPFQPALTAMPDDWSVGIVYTPTTPISQPGALVIDGSGNLWTTNCASCLPGAPSTAADSLVKFGPDGTFLGTFYNTSIHAPKGLAIDATSTYLYVANQAVSGSTHTLDEVTKIAVASGTLVSSTTNAGDFGTGSLAGVALDNSGNVWVTAPAAASSNVIELSPTTLSEINGSPFTAASGVQGPTGVATDNTGNIWVIGYANNTLGKYNSTTGPVSAYSPSIYGGEALAIDSTNNIWTVDTTTNPAFSKVSPSGTDATGSPFTAGVYDATLLAIDGGNHVLVTDCRNGCNVNGNNTGSTAPDNLLKLNSDGTPATGTNLGTYGVEIDGGFNAPAGVAIDLSGNAWVVNSGNGTLAEVIGFAAPVTQPLAAASVAGKLGQTP